MPSPYRCQTGLYLLGFALLLIALSTPLRAATPTEPLWQQQPFFGDLDKLRERQTLRVLVAYSRSNFFTDRDQIRGFEYEHMEAFKAFLNQSDPIRPITFDYIPVPFSRLIPSLLEGKGDLIAANLTITEQRKLQLAFSTPYLNDVQEVLVSHQSQPEIKQLGDLAGKSIYVRGNSSHLQRLSQLNIDMMRQGLEPIDIQIAAPHLAAEDLLELVNAQAIPMVVADNHIAEIWRSVLGGLKIHQGFPLLKNGKIAWATRYDNPKLLEQLNQFAVQLERNSNSELFQRYYQDTRWIASPLQPDNLEKLGHLVDLFTRYAKRYDHDWISLAAQAYQASNMDHSKRGSDGQIGIMQIPLAYQQHSDLQVGNPHDLENNVHAAAKYLDYLQRSYFSDPAISEQDQLFFSWAAYFAGPDKIRRVRRLAEQQGLDPNRWFDNVELTTARTLGRQPVDYVLGSYKYYISYRLHLDSIQLQPNDLQGIHRALTAG
ncbi:transporter substrate-binding domain-containing protein [Motiliproteus sp.]|uniref:transporter substrate-binding domain-containing protein n=1 Tax=Motiliproteus sp. TaxID=1898955 RepID=UPI003BA86DA1